MKDHYVFQTEAEAQTCLGYINGTSWFPAAGAVMGQPAPGNQVTVKWAEAPREMLTGEWAVPRVPSKRLDIAGVPQEDRDAFMAAFGQDIRPLGPSDFPPVVEDDLVEEAPTLGGE